MGGNVVLQPQFEFLFAFRVGKKEEFMTDWNEWKIVELY